MGAQYFFTNGYLIEFIHLFIEFIQRFSHFFHQKNLATRFEEVRRSVLEQPRDEQALKTEVIEMRRKMREHLLPAGLEAGENPLFDLKNGTGGIVDIEFMVQYAVLAWSHKHPALCVYTDNVRILDALKEEGLWEASEVLALTEAYKDFRAEAHRLSLQQLPLQVPAVQFERQSQAVRKNWQQLFSSVLGSLSL